MQHFYDSQHFIRHGAPSEKKTTCRVGRIISLSIVERPSSFEKQINSFSVPRPKNNQKQAACPWNIAENMKISRLAFLCFLLPWVSSDVMYFQDCSGILCEQDIAFTVDIRVGKVKCVPICYTVCSAYMDIDYPQ